MNSSTQSFSLQLRGALIALVAILLQINVPSTETQSFEVFADGIVLVPQIVVYKPIKELYASVIENLEIYQNIASTVIKTTLDATKTWKIVKIETKSNPTKATLWPVKGVITSKYGMRIHPVTGNRSFHNGIDIRGKRGTSIVSPADGIVIDTGWQGALGRMVRIKTPSGHTLCFGHLNSIKCKIGQKLSRGQLLGTVGATGRATGPHLHFSVLYNGNYLNPVKYLGKSF